MAAFSNAPEATFDDFYSSELARMGWQPHYEYGMLVGYWRPTALDDSRGARQAGVVDDRALEYVPADKINGGNPDPADLEYRTAGKNVVQNEPRGWDVLSTVGPAIIGTALGGAALTQAGLLGGGAAGTPEITDAMLAGANATSDPIAYLNAQAGWTAADPAYLATLTTVPPGTTTPGYSAPPAWPTEAGAAPSGTLPSVAAPSAIPSGTTTAPTPPTGGSGGFALPADIPGWLRLLAPIVGGGLLAYEAKNANGQQNPQDEWSRDYLRGLLTGPQSTNQTSGLLGTIQQLQSKRYY